MADYLKKQIADQFKTYLETVAGITLPVHRRNNLVYQAERLPELAYMVIGQRASGKKDNIGQSYRLAIETRITIRIRDVDEIEDEVDPWIQKIRDAVEDDRSVNSLAIDLDYAAESYFSQEFDTYQGGAILRHEILYRHKHGQPDVGY